MLAGLRLAAMSLALVALVAVAEGCGSSGQSGSGTTQAAAPVVNGPPPAHRYVVPRNPNPHDIYAADRPNQLAAAVRRFPDRIYVPNSESNTVSVINPHTYKV